MTIGIGRLDKLNEKSEDFRSYLGQLEDFVVMNDMKEGRDWPHFSLQSVLRRTKCREI